MIKSNLILSALRVITAKEGISARQASPLLLSAINEGLGANYFMSRLGDWRRGDRPIPQPVQDFLLRFALPSAIETCGGLAPAGEQLEKLAEMLTPPPCREK